MALQNFRRGDTYKLKLSFPGKDITGWLFTFTMKAALEDVTPALQLSKTAGDGANDDPVNGIVYLEIDSATSGNLTPGSYYYDIQRTIPGNPPNVRTILPAIDKPTEKIKVIQDVSV
jgi:hypothetical protein